MTRCERCGAEMFFAESAASGRRIPIDKDPVPGGNLAIGAEGTRLTALYVTPEPGTIRYVSHFATCKFAKEFRKR